MGMSEEGLPNVNDNNEHGCREINKSRIKTACLNCRKRKSKCDGNQICSNCSYYQRKCIYPTITVSRHRGKGKRNSKMELSHINERLNALENLLAKLSDSLSHKEPQPYKTSSVTSIPNITIKRDPIISEKQMVEPKCRFFGAHCATAMFSPSSIQWLKQKLNNDKLLAPLERIPLLVGSALKCAAQLWTNPASSEDAMKNGRQGYFPFEHDLVNEIIDAYSNLFLFSFFVDPRKIKGLFNLYYQGINHQFKYSELILMNIFLAVSLRLRRDSDYDLKLRSKYKNLSKLSEDELYKFQESCFDIALCYYNRISVINEGISTLQSLCFMIAYVISYYISDFQMMTMLSSVLIRFTKELQVNKEVFPLNNWIDDPYCYRRIWWFCQYIDMQATYKTGNPPMINNEDIPSIVRLNEEFKEVGLEFPEKGYYPIPKVVNPKFCLTPYAAYMAYISLRLKKIKRESFYELFSIQAQIENKDTELFYERIESFNSSMNELAGLTDPKIGLLTSDKRHEFKNQRTVIDEFSIVFLEKLDYYAHYILVNRTPIFQRVKKDARFKKHLNISIEYARTGLDLLNSVDNSSWSKIMKSEALNSSISIFLALLTHCLINPFEEQTLDDCRSLIEFVKNSPYGDDFTLLDCNTSYEEKITFSFIFFRVSLKILILILSNELKRDLTKEFKLQNVFASVESRFPKFFESVGDTTDVKEIIDEHCNNTQNYKSTRQNKIQDLILSLEESEACKDAQSECTTYLISNFINMPSCFQ